MLYRDALLRFIPVQRLFRVFPFDGIRKNGQIAPFLFPPEFVDGCIDHDSPDPGFKGYFIAAVPVEVLQDFEETAVQGRHRFLLVAPVSNAYGHQYGETNPVQGVLRFSIAPVGGLQQLRVNVHVMEWPGLKVG